MDFQLEFESLTSQSRELLSRKYAADPDDFREQSLLNHALELCMYRLKRFACETTLTDAEVVHLKLIETVFPEIHFRVPTEFQRHVLCKCATKQAREESFGRAKACAELISSMLPPSLAANAVQEIVGQPDCMPFEEKLSISDEGEGLCYDPLVGLHLPLNEDPILPQGDYHLDEVGTTIEHYDYGSGVNEPISESNIVTISGEVIFEASKKKFVSEDCRRRRLRRRFRGKVSADGKVLTIVRRDRSELATFEMRPYGFPMSGPQVTNLPIVGTIELREVYKIINWWTSRFYKPLSAPDLAERAFSSMPPPSLLDFAKLMI